MKYLPLVWAALWRRKLRTILTLLSVVTAFALFGTMMGLDASFQRLADLASRNVVSTWPRFGDSLTAGMEQQIERLSNVAVVGPAGEIGGYFRTPKNGVFVVFADPAKPSVIWNPTLTPAQWTELAKKPDGIYVSRQLAQKWGVKAGGDFIVTSTQTRADGSKSWHFKILDVLPDQPSAVFGFSIGNYRYYKNSRPLADQAKVDGFELTVKNSAHADDTANAIDTLFANSPIPTSSQSDASGQQTQAEGAVNVASVTRRVAAVGLFMILLLTGHGIAQSVRERLPEFAMLKTLGFSDRGIMALVIAEALVPCLVGAAIGMGVAAPLASQLPHWLPQLNLPPPYFSFWVLVEAFIAATAVALLGAAPPARRLKRLDVAAVLSGR